MSRRQLHEDILKLLRERGARYADLRESTTTDETVKVRNGSVETLASGVDRAAGVRVLVGNGWGFAADSDTSEQALRATALRALDVAAASNIAASGTVTLSPVEPVTGRWSTSYDVDPFSVPIDRKLQRLFDATEPLRDDDRIHQVSGEITSYRLEKVFASTEGSWIEQSSTETGCGLEVIALDGDEFQKRSYPNSAGGDFQARGWEFVESLDLGPNGRRIRDEALALLSAPKAPAGVFDLVIGSSQLSLQVHESCGHPTELDRALGWEISLAGGSFLQPEMLGTFRYGSPIVNLTADATIPGAIGSFGWDDEGVPGQRFHLVENGIFVNYLTGRDTAPFVGKASNGTVRGEDASALPIIRMTNISLEPGDATLDAILSGVKRGIYVETNKSWSIDDLRLNFQFGCELAYEIENGKLGRMLKNPLYTGSTPKFWGSCDAIGDRSTWRVWGLPNCGKGDPMQTMRVAHGAPVARFRGVEMA
jgi:TldD protein